MRGLVIKNTGNTYLVRTEQDGDLFCKVKGNFRLKGIRSTSPVVVGDRVIIEESAEDSSFITEIEDRKNYIVRRASNLSKHAHILAANIDQTFLFVTLKMPETSTVFIDRFLVTTEAYSVPVYLVFNKIDLYKDDDENIDYLNGLINLYNTIGYKCLQLSVLNKEGIDEIKDLSTGRITLFAGHSGVGKSSLINVLQKEADRRVGDISSYHHKGMHTTTYSEMIELNNGGYVIDTPGIKGFGTIDMNTHEVSHYFPEIFKFSAKCKYNNCLHINEPDCAVLKAIDDHYISQSRYSSYLSILKDVDEGKYR